MEARRLRLDFLIALCALLVSAVTAIAVVYQTRVIANQFSAAVWPYVSFDATYSPTVAEVDVRNDGLGPAIVRGVKLTWDGKPQPSIEALFATIGRHDAAAMASIRAALRAGQTMRVTTSTPTAGMVIPANSQHTIVRVEGALLVERFRPELSRFGLSLCYCSLTGSCWTQSYQNRAAEPRSVSTCSSSEN